MILIEQGNGVAYYKVVKETKFYMWIRQLDHDRLKREDGYDYMVPIEDKFLNDNVMQLKKKYFSDGSLYLKDCGAIITEYDKTNPGYHWLGA